MRATGSPDRVSCGLGNDSAVVDPRDLVAASCENVQVADVGNGLEDKPPTIAWAAPVPSARLSPTRTTELQVTPADDRGVTSVRFLDDDRVVCTDTAAPFTCAYRPREQDVGRNTLVAIATDAGGQTASAVRLVEVARFQRQQRLAAGVQARESLHGHGQGQRSPRVVRCSGTVAVRGGGVTRRDRARSLVPVPDLDDGAAGRALASDLPGDRNRRSGALEGPRTDTMTR